MYALITLAMISVAGISAFDRSLPVSQVETDLDNSSYRMTFTSIYVRIIRNGLLQTIYVLAVFNDVCNQQLVPTDGLSLQGVAFSARLSKTGSLTPHQPIEPNVKARWITSLYT